MKKYLVYLLATVIFFIPFFWFEPGQVNLGGDSSRLYFYDPLNYLKNFSLYTSVPGQTGYESVSSFFIPFVIFLLALKVIFSSLSVLINVYHGFMLSSSFLFIYLTINELLKQYKKGDPRSDVFIGILGGIIYITSPTSWNWDKAMVTHNQIFLNPIMFYLCLRYIHTRNNIYPAVLLLVSFIFAPNFSFIGAPSFFAFYPISFIFFVFYSKFIIRRALPTKTLLIFAFLFIAIQSLHLIPQISMFFERSSNEFKRVFTSEGASLGLSFFSSTYRGIKISKNLSLIVQTSAPLVIFDFLMFIFPMIILLGLIKNAMDSNRIYAKLFLSLGVILLFVFYLDTANITELGGELYKQLFKIPGFSMFRNNYGQFLYVFTFYYAIILSLALDKIFENLGNFKIQLISFVLAIILVINGWPFFSGYLLNLPILGSDKVRVPFKMDKEFDDVLNYVRNIPYDAKFLTLPLTDFGYQMLAGTDRGMYIGPSIIGFLGGKKDFMGYESFSPYSAMFVQSIKENDLNNVKKILAYLNIRYIYYNSDNYIYDNFSTFPYSTVKEYFPDQKSVQEFIVKLGVTQRATFANKYFIYEIKDYTPVLYTTNNLWYWDFEELDFTSMNHFSSPDTLLTFYNYSKNLDTIIKATNAIYLEPINKSIYLDVFKRRLPPKYPYAFVSRKNSWLLYRLIAWQDQLNINKEKHNIDEYIDKSLFYMGKRINELDKFRNEMLIRGDIKSISEFKSNWKEPGILEITRFYEYNTWEVTLARYLIIAENLIETIENTTSSKYSKLTNKTDIRYTLKEQRKKLRNIIQHTSIRIDKKLYLSHLTDDMFEYIEEKFNYKIPNVSHITYELKNIPQTGDYEIYIDTENPSGVDTKNLELNVDGQLISLNNQGNVRWVRYNSKQLSQKNKYQFSTKILNFENLVADSDWKIIENIETTQGDSFLYSIDKFYVDNDYGLVREISKWNPKSYYYISFDYNTNSQNFEVKLFERFKVKKADSKPLIDEIIYSNSDKTYQAIVESTSEALSAYLYFAKAANEIDNISHSDKSLVIRNLVVQKIINPKVIVIKNNHLSDSNFTTPKITYQRVNPTRYVVSVSGAKTPYILVLQQAFSVNWKIIDTNINTDNFKGMIARLTGSIMRTLVKGIQIPQNDTIVQSYLDDSIQEKPIKNIFISQKTFDTWGKEAIAQSKHFVANGYSNAWYISPEDVQGREEYELVIELVSQKKIYGGLAVSSITFFGIVIYIIYNTFKRNRKNVKRKSIEQN